MRRDAVEMLAAMGITAWAPREVAPDAERDVALEVEAATEAEAEAAKVVEPDSRNTPREIPDDVAAMGWDALEQAIAQCEKCELHQTRTHAVPGVGNRKADWMIIGEGPGQEEDRRGEPFVGPAGKLLDAMLKATGRAREDVYITNVVKCRPPRNRNPRPTEAASCQPYLARQIALIQPKLIIAVGKVAANNLLGADTSLARLRGRIHRLQPFDIPMIATYHPAYLLRAPADKAKAWADLKQAMAITREVGERRELPG